MSDGKIATKQPSGRGRVRRARQLPSITTQLSLSPPRRAQMRLECAPTSADRQASGAADGDATDAGAPTCAR